MNSSHDYIYCHISNSSCCTPNGLSVVGIYHQTITDAPYCFGIFSEGLTFGKLTLIQKRMITALTLAWIGDIINLYSHQSLDIYSRYNYFSCNTGYVYHYLFYLISL